VNLTIALLPNFVLPDAGALEKTVIIPHGEEKRVSFYDVYFL